jgi:hypothetical protein
MKGGLRIMTMVIRERIRHTMLWERSTRWKTVGMFEDFYSWKER